MTPCSKMTDWDSRYAEPGFAYGTQPNAFLAASAAAIPPGPVLCLAEGQGRNAVYLAGLGHPVVAVDQSRVGLARARELATSRGVAITTVASDLVDYRIESGAWAGIVAIFAHLPPALRADVFRSAVSGLRPGGVFLLEAYTPGQLTHGTGGPGQRELLMTLDQLRTELAGLDFLVAQEIEREVLEGKFHRGTAAVVQVLAVKTPPAATHEP